MDAVAAKKPLNGRTILIWLVAFFAVVVTVNGVMVKLAIDTLPGTEVDSAYKASLAYNAEIEAARHQAARRWSVAGEVARRPDGTAVFTVEARDAESVPLTGLIFSARLAHPTDKRADRDVSLAERETGRYRGEVSEVGPGQWDLVLAAERNGERLFLSHNRVLLK